MKNNSYSGSTAGSVIKLLLLLSCYSLLLLPVAGQSQNDVNYLDSLKGGLQGKSGTDRVDLLLEISQANWSFGFEASLDYATRAYQLAREIYYSEGEADALNRIGNVHYFLENRKNAVESYNMAYEIASSLGDFRRMGMYLNNTGLLYISLKEYDSSEVFLTRALKAKMEHGNKNLIASTIKNLGILYREKKRYNLALEYFVRQLDIHEELGDNRSLSENHRQIGEIFFYQGNYNESLKHQEHSLKYAQNNSDSTLIAYAHYHIARSLLANGEMESAVESINKSIANAAAQSYRQLLRNNYNLLYQLNKLSGNYEAALDYLTAYSKLKDSIQIENSASKYQQLERIFETENQNSTIELLQKENEVQELLLVRQNNFKILLLVLLVVILIFMVIVATRLRMILGTNRLLKEKIRELEETNEKLTESSRILEQLNATKNRFFSIIAHDLKNPFNALLGFSDIMTNNFNQLEEEEIREYISIVHLSSQNLYKLLENLLKWSASQTGTMHYLPEKFDLVILVNSEINSIRFRASKKQISISTDLPDELILNCDKLLVASVIRNLLDNAIKFTYPGGSIKILARSEGEEIFAEIADTGIGIPPEMQKRLFLLDENICRKGTVNEEGGGLGLILCKELIEKSRGRIGVQGNNGNGTRFWFRLPVENNPTGILV